MRDAEPQVNEEIETAKNIVYNVNDVNLRQNGGVHNDVRSALIHNYFANLFEINVQDEYYFNYRHSELPFSYLW